MKKHISIIGLGRLGVPLAACYALRGFAVVGIDIDPVKVRSINDAPLDGYPTSEPSVSEMVRRSVKSGQLFATADAVDAIAHTQATIIMVNTPAEPGNAYSLKYVLAAVESVAAAIRAKCEYHLVIISSTVMPGTTTGIVQAVIEKISGKKCGDGWGICYVPEFLAVGTAVADILTPQFALIGVDNPVARSQAREIIAGLIGTQEIVYTSVINAEIAKIALNTAQVMKISLANHWASICTRIPGANVDEVMGVVGRDERIGKGLLKGSVSYGGPCFARDALAWEQISLKYGTPIDLPKAAGYANERATDYLMRLIPPDKTVAVLGLAYKPDVTWAVESLGVMLAGRLAEEWRTVWVHDPMALDDAYRLLEHLGHRIMYTPYVDEAVSNSDVIVICTDWPDFANIPPDAFDGKLVIDCWRTFKQLGKGAKHIAIGMGGE
jgi:UDPglucose 6-dehydrogenase